MHRPPRLRQIASRAADSETIRILGLPSSIRGNIAYQLTASRRRRGLLTAYVEGVHLRLAFAERSSQRLNRGVGRSDAPLQLLVDKSYQGAEFGARRTDLFRVVYVLWSDEFLETRVRTPHSVQVVDVIACL